MEDYGIFRPYEKSEYFMQISDSTYRKFAVVVDEKPGKIGYQYTFKPFKAKLVKPGYDEADLHYFRKTKCPIPEGEEVIIDNWWMNFYGSYYRIKYGGRYYDIDTNSVEFDMDSFMNKTVV